MATKRRAREYSRRIAAIAGAVFVMLLSMLFIMPVSSWAADVSLGDNFVGSSNPGFPKLGSCGADPTGDYAWHFILNGLDAGTPAGTLTAEFETAGVVAVTGDPAGNGRNQHFYVYLGAPDTILSASANVADQSGTPNLVLSHVAANCLRGPLATPTIQTVPNPITAEVGDVLNDTATLEGGNYPTGTITFWLYGPGDSACSATPRYSVSVPVNGNGTYVTPAGYTADEAGVWQWVASYSGDANNEVAADSCGDEQVTVSAVPEVSPSPEPEQIIEVSPSPEPEQTVEVSPEPSPEPEQTVEVSPEPSPDPEPEQTVETTTTTEVDEVFETSETTSGGGSLRVLGGAVRSVGTLPRTGTALAMHGMLGAGLTLSGLTLRGMAGRARKRIADAYDALPVIGREARATRLMLESMALIAARPVQTADLERAWARIVVLQAIRERMNGIESG